MNTSSDKEVNEDTNPYLPSRTPFASSSIGDVMIAASFVAAGVLVEGMTASTLPGWTRSSIYLLMGICLGLSLIHI